MRHTVAFVIQSFKSRDAFDLFTTRRSRLWSDCVSVALRKLDQIESAVTLDDLRVPPGNRLELLKRDREGQHSIRINDQWRVCFLWEDDGAYEVEIVDYH